MLVPTLATLKVLHTEVCSWRDSSVSCKRWFVPSTDWWSVDNPADPSCWLWHVTRVLADTQALVPTASPHIKLPSLGSGWTKVFIYFYYKLKFFSDLYSSHYKQDGKYRHSRQSRCIMTRHPHTNTRLHSEPLHKASWRYYFKLCTNSLQNNEGENTFWPNSRSNEKVIIYYWDWWYGSVGRRACHQYWRTKFDHMDLTPLWDPHNRRSELIPANFSLTSTWAPGHVHICVHTHN